MSEIKVNTIQPSAGSLVTVTAQVQGVPGTEPNHFATVSQLGGGGAGGISRAEAQNLVDDGVATAIRHSDERDSVQNSELVLAIGEAKSEAIAHSDARDISTLASANLYTDTKISGLPGYNNTWVGGDDTGLGSEPALGCVIPLLVTFLDACIIPSGTWFVFLAIQENNPSGTDEDNAFVMSKVWTVDDGNYLKIICNNQSLNSPENSRVFYRNDSDTQTSYTTAQLPTSAEPGAWTEFTKGLTSQSDNSMKIPATIEQLQTLGNSGVIWGGGNSRLGSGNGYAIRIG
jgi:hypothetical protein